MARPRSKARKGWEGTLPSLTTSKPRVLISKCPVFAGASGEEGSRFKVLGSGRLEPVTAPVHSLWFSAGQAQRWFLDDGMWQKIPALNQHERIATDQLLRRKARFLVDENIGKLAEILRDLGWNAISAFEAGLSGHSDEDLFAFGWRKKRMIITSDLDFLDDRRFPFHRCPGVLVLPNPSECFLGFADALANALPVIGRYAGAFDPEKTVIELGGTWKIRGFSKERGIHWKARFKVDEHGQVWEWHGP